MGAVKQFNGLNGAKVTRAEIQALIALARKEEQDHVVKRLESVLKNYPSNEKFLFEIDNPALDQVPASILNGLDFEENEIITPGLNKAVSPDEIYQMITDQIIEAMEKPLDNWEKEWGEDKNGFLIAYNFETKKAYRSINQLALNPRLIDPKAPLLKNPYFLTFKQIEENKGKLKKGSKGLRVTYYTTLYRVQSQEHDIDFATYDVKKFIDFVISTHVLKRMGLDLTIEEFVFQSQLPILKYYNVFNGADVDGIDFDLDNFKLPGKITAITNHHDKLPVCEAIITAYPKPKVKFTYGGDSAHFAPKSDTINMPNLEQFNYVQAYYTTFFHEMIHSTGVEKRLKRDMSGRMKGTPAQVKKYAFEELIAEIGAMFLCSQAGILHFTVRNSLAYIKGWRSVLLKILKEDNKFVFRAATQSQKAADYLLEYVDFDKIEIPEKEEKPKREPKKASDYGKKRKHEKRDEATRRIQSLKLEQNSPLKVFYGFAKLTPKVVKQPSIAIYFKNDKTWTEKQEKYINQKIHIVFQRNQTESEAESAKNANRTWTKYEYFVNDKKWKGDLEAVLQNNFEADKNHVSTEDREKIRTLLRDGYYKFYNIPKPKTASNKTKTETEKPVKPTVKTKPIAAVKKTPEELDEINPKPKVEPNGQTALFGTAPVVPAVVESPVTVAQPISNNPKIQKIGTAQTTESQFFTVAGEVGKFLQAVERKPVHSVVITMDGQQGAGKTTTLYKFMDAFATPGNKCLFISGEEHPTSSLAIEKAEKYLSPAAKQNIDTVGEVDSTQQLYEFIAPYDVIFIDSWQKLLRMVGTIRLDEDLRKRFNGKVFVIIFQQTTDGKTKGGAEVVFDGDIIIKMVKELSFTHNYAYFDKNRYTKVPIETLRYNIASDTVYNPIPKEEPEPEAEQPAQPLNGVQLGSFTFTEV